MSKNTGASSQALHWTPARNWLWTGHERFPRAGWGLSVHIVGEWLPWGYNMVVENKQL